MKKIVFESKCEGIQIINLNRFSRIEIHEWTDDFKTSMKGIYFYNNIFDEMTDDKILGFIGNEPALNNHLDRHYPLFGIEVSDDEFTSIKKQIMES